MNARRWALLAVLTLAWLIAAFALDRAGAPEWWRYPLMLAYWLIYLALFFLKPFRNKPPAEDQAALEERVRKVAKGPQPKEAQEDQ